MRIVSHNTTRRVWALLTAEPRLTYREVADRLGIDFATVRYHEQILIIAGYIERDRNKARTVRVIVPFYGGAITITKVAREEVIQ